MSKNTNTPKRGRPALSKDVQKELLEMRKTLTLKEIKAKTNISIPTIKKYTDSKIKRDFRTKRSHDLAARILKKTPAEV